MKPVGHLYMYVDDLTIGRERFVRFARTGDARLFRPISERTHDLFFDGKEPWPARGTPLVAFMVTWLIKGGDLAGEYYSRHKLEPATGLLDAEDWRESSACAARVLFAKLRPDDPTRDQFAERRLHATWTWDPTPVEVDVLTRRAVRKGLVGR